MSLILPEADDADIVVILSGGLVDQVKAPKGLSIQVRDYTKAASGELCHDEEGRPCAVNWIKEPGEANREEDDPNYEPRYTMREIQALLTEATRFGLIPSRYVIMAAGAERLKKARES